MISAVEPVRTAEEVSLSRVISVSLQLLKLELSIVLKISIPKL